MVLELNRVKERVHITYIISVYIIKPILRPDGKMKGITRGIRKFKKFKSRSTVHWSISSCNFHLD